MLSGLLACLVGCGLGAPLPSAPPSATSSDATSSDQSSTGPAAAPSPDTGDLGPVVATRTGTIDGKRVEVKLQRIVRDQNLAHLSFVLDASTDDITIGRALSDDNLAAGDADDDTADGVTLIDPRRSKVYLAAASDYRCLCTRFRDTKLAHDQPVVVSATFAAPPAEVTVLDVQIPGFGVVVGVPVA